MTTSTSKPKPDVAKAESRLAEMAFGFPDVKEEHPWGHRAFKVRGKTFLFLGADAEGISFSVKLPNTGVQALSLGFTEPTHYGLGKSGWVTARFARGRDVPLPLVEQWLSESFCAIAPKALSKAVLAGALPPAKKPRARASKKPPARARKR